MKIDLHKITLEELLAIEGEEPKGRFAAVIIVPIPGELHESGWRRMKFVFVKRDGMVVGVSGGASDALHLNGIGGYGKDFKTALLSGKTDVVDWSIDCLPTSGCLRLFSSKALELKGFCCSDAEIISSGIKVWEEKAYE